MKLNQKCLCTNCNVFSSSLFSRLRNEDVKKLHELKTFHFFNRGEIIFHQESPCLGVFCMESGSVKLYTQEEDGREIINKIQKGGDILGHTGLFGKQQYIESAKALEPTKCCFIDSTSMKEVLANSSTLMTDLILKMSQDLIESNAKTADMVRKNVRERLATYILKMSETAGESQNFKLQLSREEMASLLGTAHETVIRCISEFKELGYIAEKNRVLYVLKKDSLQNLGRYHP
jgi:CRP-like cAMP-binding protein